MRTLTKNIIKDIRALEQRKGRREQQAWLAEGNKSVGDLLDSGAFQPIRIVATQEWWDTHADVHAEECYLATRSEIERTSLLPSPQDVLAVFALPSYTELDKFDSLHSFQGSQGLFLVLDEVQDPGNVGTIIRTADWFGIRHIICSPGTADCFSPKVVQATMSALARVRVHYVDKKEELIQWLNAFKGNIFGTFLEGECIYQSTLTPKSSVLIMGNEGRGISEEIKACVSHKILIPDFSPDGQHVESLNVSVATAICLSELRRRSL